MAGLGNQKRARLDSRTVKDVEKTPKGKGHDGTTEKHGAHTIMVAWKRPRIGDRVGTLTPAGIRETRIYYVVGDWVSVVCSSSCDAVGFPATLRSLGRASSPTMLVPKKWSFFNT